MTRLYFDTNIYRFIRATSETAAVARVLTGHDCILIASSGNLFETYAIQSHDDRGRELKVIAALADVGFIDAGFPILNDVIGGHAGTLQHGAAALHAKPYFDEGAIRPLHNDSRFPLPFQSSLRLLKIGVFASIGRGAAVVFALVSYWGGGRRVSTLSIRSSSAAMRMPIS
jgi:hypothetical protein